MTTEVFFFFADACSHKNMTTWENSALNDIIEVNVKNSLSFFLAFNELYNKILLLLYKSENTEKHNNSVLNCNFVIILNTTLTLRPN